jgi:hypothetical protein
MADSVAEAVEALIAQRQTRWPKLERYSDRQGQGVIVRARHLTQSRARVADGLAILASFGASLFVLLAVLRSFAEIPPGLEWLGLVWRLALPVAAVPLSLAPLMLGLRYLLSTQTTVKLSLDAAHFLSEGKTVSVPLSEQPEIRLWDHDRELVVEDERLREGRGYYARTFHVVWHSAGERLPVAEVFGRRRAEALKDTLGWLGSALWELNDPNWPGTAETYG